MNGLSQESLNLLNSHNPREILDSESFRPIYDPLPTLELTESTDTLTEESTANIGMKRVRSLTRPDIELEPSMKQLKIEPSWHKTEILTNKTYTWSNQTHQVYIPNPKFFPKYLGDRLPLPEQIISEVFNKYLNCFDRDIIKGETLLIPNAHLIANTNFPICAVSKASHNAWFIATWNMFDTNPNDPDNRTIN
jgi:hypothetical protein